MTIEHDALRDLMAPAALGAVEEHELARVEAHAAECAVCREELTSLRAAADVLAMAVTQQEPSIDLKASLMRTVRAEAPARAAAAAGTEQARQAVPAPRTRRTWLPSWILRPWPAVAAIAGVAALLLGWNIALQTGPQPRDLTTLAIAGTTDAPDIGGRIVYVPGEDTAVVSLTGLPQLEPDDAYQLWAIRDGRARSVGLFEPTGPDAAETVATGLTDADSLAVTAQPHTSRTTPQGPILVEAALQNG